MLSDLRFAWRALLERPGFSALAVLTLAIGIGVNAVTFAAIDSLLRKPFRFAGADTLGRIHTTSQNNPYGQSSLPDFQDLARETRTLEAVFAEARMPFSLRGDGPDGTPAAGVAEQAWGLLVSVNYFEALRVKPRMGRLFGPGDSRGSDVPVVVSERFWSERLGGSESIAGRTLTLNGRIFPVIGVVPDGFQGPGGFYEPDLWLPLERLDAMKLPPDLGDRKTAWLAVLGRMKPAVTPAQARADLHGIMAQLAAAYPATNAGRGIAFTPVVEGVPEMRLIARLGWIGLGIVAIVLLIACFNVAGLLLARASERQREIGVRAALGATQGRILRQLLTEGLLLASVSGLLALIVAAWSAGLLSAFSLPSPIPQRLHIGLDARLAAFTLALVFAAGVLPALAPALQAARADLLRALRRESARGPRPSRARNAFVIAQVAGSTLLLAAALLFVRNFLNTSRVEPGFDIDRTLVLELTPTTYGYDDTRARTFFEQLAGRVGALPGIRHVALGDRAPFSVGFQTLVDVSATNDDCAATACRTAVEGGISPGYFAALGNPLRAGREITDQEYRGGAAVAVVNETMASALWPAGGAIGQWVRMGKDGRLVQIVGVSADITHQYLSSDRRWYLYRPLRPSEFRGRIAMVMRTAADPLAHAAAVQQQVHALDPDLPAAAKSTRERLELPLWPARTAARFFLVCGSLALILASVGLFGVTCYTVSQRTREFGVRMALGATPARVVRLVLREGLTLSLPGVALGIVGALLAMRLATRLLSGVGAGDPLTYVFAAAAQGAVALAACALPAIRATRSDPMGALRQD